MSGFSAEWLALREPADHAARDRRLMERLAVLLGGRPSIQVLDLGCGTGSSLRAIGPFLGKHQAWTLVDHDPVLLSAARTRLREWADEIGEGASNGKISIAGAGRGYDVGFRQADLVSELGAIFRGTQSAGTGGNQSGPRGPWVDLVTASALFDLCSAAFIERLAAEVAGQRAVFYTALTYDGRHAWTPAHPADEAMHKAFDAHQARDKGFGPAAGPHASKVLAEAFRAHGYTIEEASSPWVLTTKGPGGQTLIDALVKGFADAVAETGLLPPATVADWRAVARTGCLVGHTDTLAVPP